MMTDPVPFVSVPFTPCPQCDRAGTVLVSTSIGNPEPGDLVICLACGAVNLFTCDLMLREFTRADLDDYDIHTLAHVIQTVKEMRTHYDRRN